MTSVESPCILVCSIDTTTGYCFGCGRTGAEITEWMTMTEQQKRTVAEALPERLKTLERKPRRDTLRRRMARERTGG